MRLTSGYEKRGAVRSTLGSRGWLNHVLCSRAGLTVPLRPGPGCSKGGQLTLSSG